MVKKLYWGMRLFDLFFLFNFFMKGSNSIVAMTRSQLSTIGWCPLDVDFSSRITYNSYSFYCMGWFAENLSWVNHSRLGKLPLQKVYWYLVGIWVNISSVRPYIQDLFFETCIILSHQLCNYCVCPTHFSLASWSIFGIVRLKSIIQHWIIILLREKCQYQITFRRFMI